MLPTQFLCMFQVKMFCPSGCQFCGYRSQRSFFFNFDPLFRIWLLFQVLHPITWQKYLSFANAEFNSASTDINLNKIGQGKEEIAYCFLLAPTRFSANSTKFTFYVFPEPSGPMENFFFPDPGDGEKLTGTF